MKTESDVLLVERSLSAKTPFSRMQLFWEGNCEKAESVEAPFSQFFTNRQATDSLERSPAGYSMQDPDKETGTNQSNNQAANETKGRIRHKEANDEAADQSSDQAEEKVTEETVPFAWHDHACQPASNETNNNPCNNTTRIQCRAKNKTHHSFTFQSMK
jgi:hypothetical protein